MGADAAGRARKRRRVNEIVDHFANLIESGRLQPGKQLPTSLEIQRMFCVHTGILMEARRELVRRDLIVVRSSLTPGKGVGTYVK